MPDAAFSVMPFELILLPPLLAASHAFHLRRFRRRLAAILFYAADAGCRRYWLAPPPMLIRQLFISLCFRHAS
jgi:hypothetical protein